MLLIKVTDHHTSEIVVMTHEVKNEGKVTEEHHIKFHPEKGAVDGGALEHYVMGKDEALELKRHL